MTKGKQSGLIASLATIIEQESDAEMLVDEFNKNHGAWLEFWYQPASEPLPENMLEIGTEFARSNANLETVYRDPLYPDEGEEE